MDPNIKVVVNLFSSEQFEKESKEAEEPKQGLKMWEKDVISKYFPEKSYILDIGCGTGREAFYLYDMSHKITAMDISDYKIEISKQSESKSDRKIELVLTDGLDLPFESNTFDVVIIWSQTFGLFYNEDNQMHLLKECNRVLKSKGVLSFSGHDIKFLKIKYPQYLDGNKFLAYAEAGNYWEAFTIPQMKDLAEKAGFEVLDCQKGKVYSEEDGTILHCECRKTVPAEVTVS